MQMHLNQAGFSPLTEAGGILVPGYATRGRVKGVITADALRKGGRLERLSHGPNGVTNVGFNLMLDSTFRFGQATQYPYFYIGLIGSTGWTGGGLQATDTPSSHPNWAEDYTHYTPATYTGTVNNSGGYSSSTTTMAITGVSQAIPAGTPFTVAGLSGTYVVTSSAGGSTPTSVTFTPGLAGSVANSVVITFGNGRPIWTPSAASGKSITNASSVNFPINADNTVIKGIFVISDPTLNGTLGVMWSSGLFQSDQTLFSGDILKLTYTVSLS
jgi:hypothetical protein